MKKKIKVLVIDDSAFIRKALKRIISSDDELEFVGAAQNGREGVELVKKLKPDVVTLDYKMPDLNGLETLKLIFEYKKIPVIMISSFTNEGGEVTLKALELGAVDFVDKTSVGSPIEFIKLAEQLTMKIKAASSAKVKVFDDSKLSIKKETKKTSKEESIINEELYEFSKIVLIGSSTGGPQALQYIIPSLPYDYPYPIIVVQHIPPFFSKSLAERLNLLSKIKVVESDEGQLVMKHRCYIAKAGIHMIFKKSEKNRYQLEHTYHPVVHLHKPSIDIVFKSAAEVFGSKAIGIILTGMGKDGVEGLKEIKKAGGTTIAESEESAIIYGMPKAAKEEKAANFILSLEDIRNYLITIANDDLKKIV